MFLGGLSQPHNKHRATSPEAFQVQGNNKAISFHRTFRHKSPNKRRFSGWPRSQPPSRNPAKSRRRCAGPARGVFWWGEPTAPKAPTRTVHAYGASCILQEPQEFVCDVPADDDETWTSKMWPLRWVPMHATCRCRWCPVVPVHPGYFRSRRCTPDSGRLSFPGSSRCLSDSGVYLERKQLLSLVIKPCVRFPMQLQWAVQIKSVPERSVVYTRLFSAAPRSKRLILSKHGYLACIRTT